MTPHRRPAAAPVARSPRSTAPTTAAAARAALPGRVRLARHRSVLPLGAEARVVGLDPELAVVVEGLAPPLTALLDRLDRPARTAELVAAAAAAGVPDTVTRHLL